MSHQEFAGRWKKIGHDQYMKVEDSAGVLCVSELCGKQRVIAPINSNNQMVVPTDWGFVHFTVVKGGNITLLYEYDEGVWRRA